MQSAADCAGQNPNHAGAWTLTEVPNIRYNTVPRALVTLYQSITHRMSGRYKKHTQDWPPGTAVYANSICSAKPLSETVAGLDATILVKQGLPSRSLQRPLWS